MTATRLVREEDAPRLADLVTASREHLAPWEPFRAEEYFSVEGQRAAVRTALDQHAEGGCLPHVVLDEQGLVAGRITLTGIVRGPFRSGNLGYWVNQADIGRGLATAAVRRILRVAFEELGLHRVQAGTLVHNVASQRVLQRNGFVQFGVAPKYLRIAGEWRDHVLFQVLSTEPVDRAAAHD